MCAEQLPSGDELRAARNESGGEAVVRDLARQFGLNAASYERERKIAPSRHRAGGEPVALAVLLGRPRPLLYRTFSESLSR